MPSWMDILYNIHKCKGYLSSNLVIEELWKVVARRLHVAMGCNRVNSRKAFLVY